MEKRDVQAIVSILNGRVVTEDGVHEGWSVELAGIPGRMRITTVGPGAGRRVGPTALGPLAEVIDAAGGYVLPGFVDIHVHGGGGSDFMDATPEDWLRIAAAHAQHGTTTMLATTMSAPEEALLAAARTAKEVRRRQGTQGTSDAAAAGAAWIAGLHLEGPFLNEKAKGAQNGAFLREPSLTEVERLHRESGEMVRLVTVAPELPGALDLIRGLRLAGIRTACGHTRATYGEVVAAVGAGLSLATHTFNAMGQLHHREPGVVGAALELDAITAQAIADGIHVHPGVLRILVRAKTPSRLALITDAMRAMGLDPGEYELGGLTVTVRPDGSARLADGTLAGSMLSMDSAVHNAVRLLGVTLPQVSAMASRTPAEAVGLGQTKGRLAVGFDDDIVIMDAESLEVTRTISGGRTIHNSQHQ